MEQILYSPERTELPFLEPVLEQLISEMGRKQSLEPCRETVIIITKLEEALHWQLARENRKVSEGRV